MTGIPDSHIMLNDGENDSVVTDDSCVIHPTWNASVCTGDVGRLNLSDSRRRTSSHSQSRNSDRSVRFALFDRWKSSGRGSGRSSCSAGAHRACSKWQGISHHRQPEHCACRHRDPGEDRKTGSLSSLAEMDLGSWVIFEFPGFTKAASGTEQPSMDALRKANATSYFRGGDALWVKLVVTKPPLPIVRPTDLQASIAVSR